jgi:DNA-binding IclR family transcriptional regulator
LLGVFTAADLWLGVPHLTARTGLPSSTVTRIARSLVLLGYLHYAPDKRKFRLAGSVLGLGYAAIANSDLQRAVRIRMQAFASEHKVHLNLSYRDRLDLIVLETCRSSQGPALSSLPVGGRVGIASSPMGWALLAALPEIERDYLLENVEHRMPREWARLRRRSIEAIAQVHQQGFCTALEWDCDRGIVAAPLRIDDHAPLVLACTTSTLQMKRSRVERDLGPRLLAMVAAMQKASVLR